MTTNQNAYITLAILILGEPATDWLVAHRLFIGTMLLIIVGILFIVDVLRASKAK